MITENSLGLTSLDRLEKSGETKAGFGPLHDDSGVTLIT